MNIAINRMYKVLKTAGIEPADLVSRPGGLVWVDRMDDIEPFNFTPPPSEAYMEENIVKEDIQEATATYAETRGAQSRRDRTATEHAIRERASSIRFEVKSMLFESFGLKRLGMFYDLLNQQFIDDVKQVRVESDSGYVWQDIGSEDIVGNFDYKPTGTALEPILDVVNHRNDMLALFAKFHQDPEIKTRELKKRVLEAFGIKDVENLLKSEAELAQELQGAAGGAAGLEQILAQGQVGTPMQGPAISGAIPEGGGPY
ncbi:MAG: hypothetical protein DDT19_02227 [Syntrophomonadaceae bacterium]|nr:hypothetical protein [Bacillota bacterium]